MDSIYYFFTPVLAYVFRPIYNFLTSFGVPENYLLAILVFTVLIRLILLPSTVKQQKGTAKQMRMQAKIRRIQEKYKDYQGRDKQQLIQQETQELYAKEGFSASSAGCLPLLIQLPVLSGLYGIIRFPLKYVLKIDQATIDTMVEAIKDLLPQGKQTSFYQELYVLQNLDSVVERCPDISADVFDKMRALDFSFLGMNLGEIPQFSTLKNIFSADVAKSAKLLLLIPLFAIITSLLSSVLTQVRQKKQNPDQANNQMMGCMMFSMPLFSLYTFLFPAGMGIYWIISNVLSFLQTLIIGYTHSPKKLVAKVMIEETIERRSKENNTKIQIEKNL